MTEFEMAYHHSVVVKLKKRLIVLMMLDSPADLYQNDDRHWMTNDTEWRTTLSQYMRQYTYIDYMADDWLDKLLYALPLRGLLHDSEDHGASDGASSFSNWSRRSEFHSF